MVASLITRRDGCTVVFVTTPYFITQRPLTGWLAPRVLLDLLRGSMSGSASVIVRIHRGPARSEEETQQQQRASFLLLLRCLAPFFSFSIL